MSDPDRAEAHSHRSSGKGELVLVVEDEPSLRTLVALMVESLGYRVDETANADEALRLVEEDELRPHLVVTDVVMPGLSGFALVERLRQTLPGLRAIYMSGHADDTILNHGFIDPGVELLRKPFDMSELAARIEMALLPQATPDGGGGPAWQRSAGAQSTLF